MSGEQDLKYRSPQEACRLFDADLASYLEGEARPTVEVHARECAFCGTLLADLQEIRSRSAELPLEEPPVWMWAKIRTTLVAEGIIRQPEGFWQRFFSAGRWIPQAVPVAGLVGLVMVGVALLRQSSTTTSPKTAGPPPVGDDTALATVVTSMEQDYYTRLASFDPSLKETYQKSLIALDGEIQQLRGEPHDSLAHEYLMAAYTEKARVLQSALEFDGR